MLITILLFLSNQFIIRFSQQFNRQRKRAQKGQQMFNDSDIYSYQNNTLNTRRAQMVILAILHVSAWGCLIRSDYNFVFLFFAYFYLVSKKDFVSVTITFALVIVLQTMDLIFFVFVPNSWMNDQTDNYLWNNLKGLHGFAIFIAVIVFILKIPLLYFLFVLRKEAAPK